MRTPSIRAIGLSVIGLVWLATGLMVADLVSRWWPRQPQPFSYVVALALLLSGCASSKAPSGLDDGQAHGINCSGPDRTWALCGEKAAEICSARGYDVLAAGGGTAGMVVTQNPSSGFDGPATERSILIRCR